MPARSLRTDGILVPRAVTRLVVLGNPHGDLAGLEAVLAREPERSYSAGDNIGYAGGPASFFDCASPLESLGIASVYGNHEAWLGEDGTLAIALDTPVEALEPRGAGLVSIAPAVPPGTAQGKA